MNRVCYTLHLRDLPRRAAVCWLVLSTMGCQPAVEGHATAALPTAAPSPAPVISSAVPAAEPSVTPASEVGTREVVSGEQNDLLWSAANLGVVRFIGAGLLARAGGRDGARWSRSESSSMNQGLDELTQALVRIEKVSPPAEQAKSHAALLPVYRRALATMQAVAGAVKTDDEATAEVEWERLTLLVGEARSTISLIAGPDTPGPVIPATNTDPAVPPTPTQPAFPTAPRQPAIPATPTPTIVPAPPPPTPTKRPAVEYRDDFTNPSSGFKLVTSRGQARMGYGNGYLEVAVLTSDSQGLGLQENYLFDYFTLEVDVAATENGRSGYLGVDFRVAGDDYEMFYVDPFRQMFGSRGKFWNVIPEKSEAVRPGTAKNHLKIVAIGASVSMSVNGVEVLNVKESQPRAGGVALTVSGAGGPMAGRFSNLIVKPAS